ncbi:dockerin type I domain-containing protein [Pseudocolwellia sp. AS88]|uniref:dockerin type I domain-containing protein n=1 Tax=Pseudocolwellia sp. AS88 TaxID=3063958 RepID=UPI0026EE8BA0|nr:dockerin type I domain-containing protein [Pseudocolwellia sp. AS88]MDO7085507.1 dockerin type I domain-containing protein [Pseudocolwellia sp. AS88]
MNNCLKLTSIALACIFTTNVMAAVTPIQIQATESTDYGNDSVATMYSSVQTAEDGLATYQVAFDVTPPTGQNVRSRSSAGAATTFSWGIGDDAVFKGSDTEYADIDNLRIVNFNANGGTLTVDDFKGLAFTHITFVNGQSPNKDAVKIVTNNTVSNDLGNLSLDSETINLELLEGVIPSITSVRLEAGDSSNQTTNKWSVDSVEVTVDGIATEDRAYFLRGSWGINWKPALLGNGVAEGVVIDYFIDQIKDLKTIDYIQVHLGESYIYSPVHLAPHDLLESFWQGDTDENGNIINLIVPRAEAATDPFYEMLLSIKNAGMKTQAYVNSSNMLEREEDIPNPDSLPDITERWKEHCDTDPEVQAFLNSQTYHYKEGYPDRPYMFAYAEFVLKVYSERYGDLIDSWLFDSGETMVTYGDISTNGNPDDQLIFKAFADAARAGNSHAAVAFNNGPERITESLNPFSEATRHDDYMFGHPYNGGRVIGNHDNGLYDRNYAHIQKITETNGNVHIGNEVNDWDWDDKVVGHFDPPMSTTSWNGGNTPALTDEEFKLWNLEATKAGGAISWGVPLVAKNSGVSENFVVNEWGIAQLTLMDDHLSLYQQPGAPNWARADTALPDAIFSQPYSRELVEGVDFWDPEGDAVTLRLLDVADGAPAWLTLVEDESNIGTWLLQGTPTETENTEYQFRIQAIDASGTTERWVKLVVGGEPSIYPYSGNTQIFATPDTDYGVNNIATMISGVQAAPDGLATFQIAFDATPMDGGNIASGSSGGVSTNTSWGIGDDYLFKGSDTEFVDSISNLRIVNFAANGGDLKETDITELSFNSVEIVNGQSTHDRILVTANGVSNSTDGEKMADTPAGLSLTYGGFDAVTELTLGVGNATDNTRNKWSVNNFSVNFIIEEPTTISAPTGDLNGDSAIDRMDMMIIRDALGSSDGDASYVATADLDNDGTISRADYSLWYQLFRNQ